MSRRRSRRRGDIDIWLHGIVHHGASSEAFLGYCQGFRGAWILANCIEGVVRLASSGTEEARHVTRLVVDCRAEAVTPSFG